MSYGFSPDAFAAKSVIDDILEYSDIAYGRRLYNLSKIFKRYFGVHLWGYNDNVVYTHTNPNDFGESIGDCPTNGWNPSVINKILVGLGKIMSDKCDVGTPHNYEISRNVCEAGETNCNIENVFCYLRKWPAPLFRSFNSPVEDHDDTSYEAFGGNPVRIYLHEDDGKDTRFESILKVVTKPTHLLHNPDQVNCSLIHPVTLGPTFCSTVWRIASEDIQGISIITRGTGIGPLPRVNERLAPGIFKHIDGQLVHNSRPTPSPRIIDVRDQCE